MIHIQAVDPASPAAQSLIRALDQYQGQLYPDESNHHDPLPELQKAHVHFLGAFEEEELVGCGAVKLYEGEYAELKRMYVSPSCRGQGVGQRILAALEGLAQDHGLSVIRLETGIHHSAALAFYEQSGYQRRGWFPPYPSDDDLSVFMEKKLSTKEPQ